MDCNACGNMRPMATCRSWVDNDFSAIRMNCKFCREPHFIVATSGDLALSQTSGHFCSQHHQSAHIARSHCTGPVAAPLLSTLASVQRSPFSVAEAAQDISEASQPFAGDSYVISRSSLQAAVFLSKAQ